MKNEYTQEQMKEYREKQEIRRAELENTILSTVSQFKQSPDVLKEYFEFSVQFHQYSPRNKMLIFRQNPKAMFCKSYNDFRRMGYYVKKGEKGMDVLTPVKIKYISIGEGDDAVRVQYKNATKQQREMAQRGEAKIYVYDSFKIGRVFDISQTTCPAEDYPKYLDIGFESQEHKKMFDMLKLFAEKELNVRVREGGYSSIGTRGEYDLFEAMITTSENYNDSAQLSILTHELGHAMLHSTLDSLAFPSYVREFEADCVSILLLKRLGFEIPDSRIEHASEQLKWINMEEDAEFRICKSIDRASKAYDRVIDFINERIGPGREDSLVLENEKDREYEIDSSQREER